MRALDALALAASLLLAPVVLAQGAADTLRFGAPSGTGPFTVPITLGDLAGTPLGVDRPAGERIQAFAVTVRFEPAAAVASATLSRAGLLAARTPAFETTASGAGTITWVGSFEEAEGAIPFTQPPGTGDTVLSLAVTLAPGATASASLDPATTTLSNQAGTTSESADGGTLALGPPVLLPTAGTTAPPVPAPGFAGLLALAAATAAAGAALSRRA